MRVAIYSTHEFEKEELRRAARDIHSIEWITESLTPETTCRAAGCDAVVVFANDDVSAATLDGLDQLNIKYVTTRSTGYNHIDTAYAKTLGIKVGYVPEYSPFAVAEHTVAMMLFLSRNFQEAYKRVLKFDFHLDGLTGFTLHGKTIGLIGLGHIGAATAQVLSGFGCEVLGYDIISKKKHRDKGVC